MATYMTEEDLIDTPGGAVAYLMGGLRIPGMRIKRNSLGGIDVAVQITATQKGTTNTVRELVTDFRGQLFIANPDRQGLVDDWTRQGKVFITNNPVIGQPETMSAAGTAITLTAPSLRFTVPAGLIVCPIMVQVDGLRVITKDDIFAVIATGSDSFTSGGDAVLMTAKNAMIMPNSAAPRGSQIANLHYSDTAIVEAALVNPRLLKRLKHEGVTGEVDAPFYPEYNILKGDNMVYIQGPGSFLVFHVQETTAAEDEWSMSWAELNSDDIAF